MKDVLERGLLWFWVALACICFSLYVLCRCVLSPCGSW